MLPSDTASCILRVSVAAQPLTLPRPPHCPAPVKQAEKAEPKNAQPIEPENAQPIEPENVQPIEPVKTGPFGALRKALGL